MSILPHINKQWTLFLDRDGVINIEKENDYIRNASELHVYPQALEAIAFFNVVFKRIVVVTNQRGIGKGLMTEQDLHGIHKALNRQLSEVGGRIDAFYFAPQLSNDAIDRKPNTGMGLQAKRDFADIDFSCSVMVGNNISDMQFGRNLGMFTVYVNTTSPRTEPHASIDLMCRDLFHFSEIIRKQSIQ